MHVVSRAVDLRAWCAAAVRPLALVPTMGAIHRGHLSLVTCANRDGAASVVASIFVNPRQFGDPADFARYPRSLGTDLTSLKGAGVDVVFAPPVDEVYPPGFATSVSLNGPALPLEGEWRPGHFTGVATVVTRLLLLTLPDVAYFGQKDAQQVAVVRRLVGDLGIPTRLAVGPTVREADGLPVSSRNVRLTPRGRIAAATLYQGLAAAVEAYRNGMNGRSSLEAVCRRILASEPLVTQVDYVALVDPGTFELVEAVSDHPAVLAVAAWVDGVRLIDNVLLGGDG